MTTRVDILKESYEKIKFPLICPVCGINKPDSTLNMRTYISYNQPLKEKIGNHWNLDVPVCTSHKKKIRIGRIVSSILFFLLILLSMLTFYGIWLAIGDQHWAIYTVIGIGLISSGIFIHSKIYSAPLLLESFSYKLLFTFRDDVLAEKFARLNGIDKVQSPMNQSRKISK
jgi:hypothetical protein